MSVLLAVDGSSIFMRALSVLPEDKRTVDDLEYLSVGMLRKAVRKVKADYLVVALDSLEPCWRCAVHPEYKGDRKYSDLRPKQLTPMVRPRLEARGIATAYHPEMEADDLLATLAFGLKQDHTMYCYTRDSDLLFLTHLPGVRLLWPENGGELTVVDREAATARLGHRPEWQPLIRALTADSKDNLRALLGVPKGWRCPLTKPRAIELLDTFQGDLFTLIQVAIDEECEGLIKPKELEYIRQYHHQIGGIWHCANLRPDAILGVGAQHAAVRHANLTAPFNDQ